MTSEDSPTPIYIQDHDILLVIFPENADIYEDVEDVPLTLKEMPCLATLVSHGTPFERIRILKVKVPGGCSEPLKEYLGTSSPCLEVFKILTPMARQENYLPDLSFGDQATFHESEFPELEFRPAPWLKNIRSIFLSSVSKAADILGILALTPCVESLEIRKADKGYSRPTPFDKIPAEPAEQFVKFEPQSIPLLALVNLQLDGEMEACCSILQTIVAPGVIQFKLDTFGAGTSSGIDGNEDSDHEANLYSVLSTHISCRVKNLGISVLKLYVDQNTIDVKGFQGDGYIPRIHINIKGATINVFEAIKSCAKTNIKNFTLKVPRPMYFNPKSEKFLEFFKALPDETVTVVLRRSTVSPDN